MCSKFLPISTIEAPVYDTINNLLGGTALQASRFSPPPPPQENKFYSFEAIRLTF